MTKQLLLLFTLTLTFLCSSCAASINKDCPVDKQKSAKIIYLVSHGWHVGIVVKRSEIPDDVWPNHNNFAGAEYLEIGWGDQAFLSNAIPWITNCP